MGLDWNPIGKPKPGHEAEFVELFELLGDGPRTASWGERLRGLFRRVDREAATARWLEIQDSPYVTLAAPQVGRDPRADAWARQMFREHAPKDQTEDEFIAAMQDYYVVAQAPPCDGIPLYSNGSAGYVEPFSFRAQFVVKECKDAIDRALIERCYRNSLAPELDELGADLRACADRFAGLHGVGHVAAQRDIDAAEGSAASKAHILYSAARWCEWWSSRGHGLEAYV